MKLGFWHGRNRRFSENPDDSASCQKVQPVLYLTPTPPLPPPPRAPWWPGTLFLYYSLRENESFLCPFFASLRGEPQREKNFKRPASSGSFVRVLAPRLCVAEVHTYTYICISIYFCGSTSGTFYEPGHLLAALTRAHWSRGAEKTRNNTRGA